MRYLSLFSGIEAATVAWAPLGWECVAVAEIEPFPCAVLAHHYPDVPNLGDVTAVTAGQIASLGQIDLVVFGSPCQDLSVAGKRRGFEGERSGLFFTAINIIQWAREFCGCRWALWENVPGAFTSNNGRDFAAVVEFLAGVDGIDVPPKGWGTEGCALGTEAMVEWAVLDAQWFGVAQRRRRVFALADFGDWTGRPPILLEPEGLRGDSSPRREAGQVVAALTRTGVGTCGADDNQAQAGHIRPVVASKQWPAEVACTLDASFGNKQGLEDQHVNSGCPLFVPAYGFNSNALPDQMRLTAELSETLTCSQHPASVQATQVRRLTPVECERLQGFPDNYTLIPVKGKPAADGPRYKALGNSMAVPVMRWIGQGIDAVALFQ